MPFVVVSAVAFVFAFVGSMPVAGPGAILVVSRAALREYKSALLVALGGALAEGVYAGLSFWGFATFLARHQVVLPISHGISAVVMIGLGGYFVFWRPRRLEETDKDEHQRRREENGSFFLGIAASALNPTLIFTWSAVVAALYSRQIIRLDPLLAFPFGAFCAAGGLAWNLVLLKLLKKLGGKVPDKVLRWFVRAIGLVIVAIGVWSAVGLVLYLHDPQAHPIKAD
jgi:threonine/homoserine/homoserine lactone efflux protein